MKWGIWSFNEGLRKSEEEKFERRKDLTDVHLRAVTEYNPPFTKLKDVDKDELPVGYKVRKAFKKENKKCGFFSHLPLPLNCRKFPKILWSKRVKNRQKVSKTPFTLLKKCEFGPNPPPPSCPSVSQLVINI